MLEAHLNPEWDAASRKHSTIDRSVKWLSGIINKMLALLLKKYYEAVGKESSNVSVLLLVTGYNILRSLGLPLSVYRFRHTTFGLRPTDFGP